MRIITKQEADLHRTSNLKTVGIFLETIGYCKETSTFLIRTQEGVQEVSDLIIRHSQGDTWYEKYEI